MTLESVYIQYNPMLKVNESHYLLNKSLHYYRTVSIEDDDTELVFAGRGDIGRENCGDHYGFFSCKGGHLIEHRNNYCYKLTCPICFHKSISRTSKRITKRCRVVKRLYRKLGYRIQIKHYSFNTMWQIRTAKDFDKYRIKLTKILDGLGLNGILIFHKYRTKQIPEELINAGISPNLVFFPHFHFLGFVLDRLPDYDSFKESYKFTYTNITDKWFNKDPKKYPKFLNSSQINRTMTYLLSHCSFKKGSKSHSYFWVGDVSPQRTFKLDEEKKSRPKLCPDCEKEFDDGKIYKVENPEFAVFESDNNKSEKLYVLSVPYSLNSEIFLVERVYRYDLWFKSKKDKNGNVIGRFGPESLVKTISDFVSQR